MKAKTRHWFIYQQPCFRFHIFAIHLIGVRIMPSCGARPEADLEAHNKDAFQSTRPMRGATELICHKMGELNISIHAPLAGRDVRTARTRR